MMTTTQMIIGITDPKMIPRIGIELERFARLEQLGKRKHFIINQPLYVTLYKTQSQTNLVLK